MENPYKFINVIQNLEREFGPKGAVTAQVIRNDLSKLDGDRPGGFRRDLQQYTNAKNNLEKRTKTDHTNA